MQEMVIRDTENLTSEGFDRITNLNERNMT